MGIAHTMLPIAYIEAHKTLRNMKFSLSDRAAGPGSSRGYRVLMIAPTSFFADYGCHVRILEEALVLQKLGHEVTIATYRNGDDVPGLDIQRTLPIPWRKEYEVGSSRHKIVFDALLGLKTLELLARRRFDIIHAHLHEGALIGTVLGALLRVPVVFDFQGSLTGEMLDHQFLKQGSPLYPLLLRLERWLDHSAAIVLTSSVHARRLLLDEFRCAPERVRTLPDCVNADAFKPATSYEPAQLAALKAQLGIPLDRKLIVYLGLLAEYQGIDLLLAAMSQIVHQRQDVHLLLMGFPNEGHYRQRALDLGIGDFVTLTGRVPYAQAPIHLALGDVAAAPKLSLTEGAGKLLNYMAVGLPTVAFGTPVAREYLGPNGVYAAMGDATDLAARLLSCLFPPQGAAAPELLGQLLRQRAVHLFGWDAAAHYMLDAYRELVGEKVDATPAPRQSPVTYHK